MTAATECVTTRNERLRSEPLALSIVRSSMTEVTDDGGRFAQAEMRLEKRWNLVPWIDRKKLRA